MKDKNNNYKSSQYLEKGILGIGQNNYLGINTSIIFY